MRVSMRSNLAEMDIFSVAYSFYMKKTDVQEAARLAIDEKTRDVRVGGLHTGKSTSEFANLSIPCPALSR